MSAFKPYKSYNFKDKDPIIDRTRTVMQDHGATYKQLADDSGLAPSTIYNIFDGPTRFPRHATIAALLGAMGYSFSIVPRRSDNVISIRKKAK